MFQRQLEDLKCTGELYKESYLKDLQDKLSLLKIVTKIANIETLNNSAGKKGNTPSAHSFSKGTKLNNQIKPNI